MKIKFSALISASVLFTILLSGCGHQDSEFPATDSQTETTTEGADIVTDQIETPTMSSETETEEEKPMTNSQLIRRRQTVMVTAQTTAALRDPCVLLYEGVYYMYGTGWQYATSTALDESFSELRSCVELPADFAGDPWAPEVYEYKGKFYMFTTYRSTKNDHRGCAVFVADSPAGPFKLHSGGHITPNDQDAIDGTLYIDEAGQPWMIYVDEWTSTKDGIGRFSCAKLSEDLSRFISEPIEMFRADDSPLNTNVVTDGCFVYRNADGGLVMIWSSFVDGSYAVLVATNESGDITGSWSHSETLLYSSRLTGRFDGGHGMIFTDAEGRMWMSIHSPNKSDSDRFENPTFIPLKEKNGELVWDLSDRGYNKS